MARANLNKSEVFLTNTYHRSIKVHTQEAQNSMITVVEFRAKQATGSWFILTQKLYANFFFIRIDLDWLEHPKGGKILVFKAFFQCQKSAEFIYFFFSIIGGHIPVDCLALNCTTVQPEFVSIKICNFRPHFINFSKINFYEVNLVLQCSQSHNAYVSIYGNLFYE